MFFQKSKTAWHLEIFDLVNQTRIVNEMLDADLEEAKEDVENQYVQYVKSKDYRVQLTRSEIIIVS